MNRWLLITWLTIGLLIRLTTTTLAQTTTLTGTVADAVTGKAMPFANIYLNGSTRGTLTNENGYYKLTGVPLGTVEVVASFVGYQSQRRTLRLNDSQEKRANFRLKPGDQTLATVIVRANPKLWQRHLKQFKRQLFGEPFGAQCQIMNSEVLSFREENGHLKATATEPIVIENQALGYRMWYELVHFDGSSQKVYYAGTTRFEELKAADERQANRFQRNRMRAYKGSIRHLMASLIDSTYEREGFLVYQEDITKSISRNRDNRTTLAGSIKNRLHPLIIRQLILPGQLPSERRLVTNRQLVVFYTLATSNYSPYVDARYAYSQITLPAGRMQLTVDGVITMPEGMEIQGSLADDRLSTMLPDDWKPNQADPVAAAPVLAQGKLMPPDARLGRITATFNERFRALAPVLFVHTDKPIYATGDRLWLSAYLLDAGTNRLLAGETAIHVDLLTPGGKLVQHQWLRVADGRTAGDFRLSDSLETGTYRLRAYTDEDDGQRRPAFERSVAVYNLIRSAPSALPDTISKPVDVQFLPEGGRWVAGVESRLGVKVVGPDGRGVSAMGRIVNKEGVEVSRFKTTARGIGSVVLSPLAGQTYTAQVISNTRHKHQVAPLPPFESKGLTLSADAVQDTNRLLLTITGGRQFDLDSVYVLIQQQGRLVDQRKIQLQNGTARVSLSTVLMPAGLNQITLYDAMARPQAERLVFLPERVPPVRVVLSVNKARYKPREQAILSVTLNDDGLPALAALSAAITDAEQVPDDTAAATIQAHVLLTGELRGKVEQPDAYFNENSFEARRAIDDLLLTQGWRRVSGTPDTETLGGVSLTGRVLNAKNQPIPGAQVIVASTASGLSFMRSAGADEKGRFRLAGLAIADTVKLLMQLADRQLKNLPVKEARVVLDGPGLSWEPDTSLPSDWTSLRAQLAAARIRQDGDAALYRDKTVKLLSEVTVRARKLDERPDDVRRASLHSGADATLVFDDRSPRFANLYEMIRGRLAGVNVSQNMTTGEYSVIIRGVGSLESSTQPLFLMDGRPVINADGVGLLAFNPTDIERVEVLKNAGTAGIYGVRGGSGVIAFYSKRFRPGELSTSAKASSTTLSLIGYPSVQREFYVPRYENRTDENQPADSARIDRRDILYWKPVSQTDSQGHSQLIIPLSDVVRTIRVVIQGVTSDGRPVVGKALFQVQ